MLIMCGINIVKYTRPHGMSLESVVVTRKNEWGFDVPYTL